MKKPKTKVKKINSNNFFEQMQREKEAEAERRLEEQRFVINRLWDWGIKRQKITGQSSPNWLKTRNPLYSKFEIQKIWKKGRILPADKLGAVFDFLKKIWKIIRLIISIHHVILFFYTEYEVKILGFNSFHAS